MVGLLQVLLRNVQLTWLSLCLSLNSDRCIEDLLQAAAGMLCSINDDMATLTVTLPWQHR